MLGQANGVQRVEQCYEYVSSGDYDGGMKADRDRQLREVRAFPIGSPW